MDRIPVTPNGIKLYQQRLTQLKEIERLRIAEAIKTARAFGDLKENSEYQTAINEQLFLEKKIEILEKKIRNAFVIDITKFINNNRVIFGSSVVLEDLYNFKKMKYKIVGTDEVNIVVGHISINSPIAKSLINRYKNEIIHLHVPKGLAVFKISDIIYI